MSGYAVVDVETTGLFPGKHDRIVEIAIVEVSVDGQITDEWCTLLNPGRDLGPQRLHGIRAADVVDAPSFADIAGDVAGRLMGRIFTAHNASFDALFLAAEFNRAGIAAPIERECALCTMRLAGRYLPGAARSLADCCQAAGIELIDAHSALGDAKAAAALLRIFLSLEHPPPWLYLADYTRVERWPRDTRGPGFHIPKQRGASEQESDGQWVNRLVTSLPRVPEPPTADGYLEVLDRALLDRELSRTEKADLLDLAEQMGLSRSTLLEIHRSYVDALAVAAWADGKVTDDERADLRKVALLLGLDDQSVGQSLEAAGPGSSEGSESAKVRPDFSLNRGDRVVFTGDMVRPRDEWIRLIEKAGLVTGGVTKSTKLVVAADTDSMSGKAKKARDYGIAVVGEAAFTKLFGQYLVLSGRLSQVADTAHGTFPTRIGHP